MKRALHRRKFKPVRSNPVTNTVVKDPDTSWHTQRFAERDTARVAARNEVEMVDNQLRSTLPVVDGAERQAWALGEGTLESLGLGGTWWQRQRRTISGRMRGWLSLTKN